MKAVSNGSAPIYYVKSSVLGQVAMEIEGSQAVLNRAYVYASGKLIAEQTPDGQFYWTHNDHLGSTRRLTNTSGAVVWRGEFDPYGKAVLETGSVSLNSHKFTGYERDWATGSSRPPARPSSYRALRRSTICRDWPRHRESQDSFRNARRR
ncbi:MAG TPA: RHS domain-containing protein [Blastocatellia bacterium]|nr:RHS domain-containing protein [Blastocatellia bacterium]